MFGFRLSGRKGILQRSQLEQKRTAPNQGGFVLWRKRWDSNPRRICTLSGFRVRCIQPLCHVSDNEVKPNKNADALCYFIFIWFLTPRIGGSGEIRTHGGLSTLDGFQDRCIKPLCHASVFLKKKKNNNEVYTFCQALFSENT